MREGARVRGAARGTGRLWRVLPVVLVFGAAAFAQGVRSVGTSTAEVPLQVTFDLQPVLQLQLEVDTLGFDLNRLGGPDDAVCVLGSGPDVYTGTGPDGGDEVAPAGTTLTIDTWPTLAAHGARPLTLYPPPPEESEGGVVCYRAFMLGAYANVGSWQLGVERADAADGAPIPALYVVGVCPDAQVSGLLPIADGERRTMRLGDTGDGCTEMLGAVGVRIDGGVAGTARTELRYTLLAADADFATE
jgi:hypothetical protein